LNPELEVRFEIESNLEASQVPKKQKKIMKELKTENEDAEKKWSNHEVRGVSPEAGRESVIGKICGVGF